MCHVEPEAYGNATFGEGQGYIYIKNVQCNGSESTLEDCPASEVAVNDCTHSEDAGVRCQSMCTCLIDLCKLADMHIGNV